MKKRITSLYIKNYRAYCDENNVLQLPNGENVLIYGENGSGKSSLYKAISNYFSKSTNPSFTFVKNKYFKDLDGEIKITFSDFDDSLQRIDSNPDNTFSFTSSYSNNDVEFIQTASLIKGLLDYTDLLKVYLHNEERPNLFELIVLSLLGNHIPLSSGGTFTFKGKWTEINNKLIKHSYTRRDGNHQGALNDLIAYETRLRSTLNSVFEELNRLLSSYFSDLSIKLEYELSPLNFNYGDAKWQWHTTADLRLDVFKDDEKIEDGYNDFLNEARLSAIAICLYLASLLKNPTNVELKILFLDDVFIGLDAGNRIPILNILQNEFSDYQKFISTYDRHWFELAKRQFEVNNDKSWSTLEIYVGSKEVGNKKIPKPIITSGLSHYETAIRYLHHNTRPDYPASSNYFRKSIEELIQKFAPKYELVDAEKTLLADYKLTKLLLNTRFFLEKINEDVSNIIKITGLLNSLIHPLSHHEITSPIYKNELLILENTIPKLKKQLIDLDIESNFKCVLEKGKRIKIIFEISNNEIHYYQLKLSDNLIAKKKIILGNINITLCKCQCFLEEMSGVQNGQSLKKFRPSKKNSDFNYHSLENAFSSIKNYITSKGKSISNNQHYISHIKYFNGKNWIPLFSKY